LGDWVGDGYVVRDNFLGSHALHQLKQEVMHWKSHNFLHAGQTAYGTRRSLRGDIQLPLTFSEHDLEVLNSTTLDAWDMEADLMCNNKRAHLNSIVPNSTNMNDEDGQKDPIGREKNTNVSGWDILSDAPSIPQEKRYLIPGGKSVFRCLIRRLLVLAKYELNEVLNMQDKRLSVFHNKGHSHKINANAKEIDKVNSNNINNNNSNNNNNQNESKNDQYLHLSSKSFIQGLFTSVENEYSLEYRLHHSLKRSSALAMAMDGERMCPPSYASSTIDMPYCKRNANQDVKISTVSRESENPSNKVSKVCIGLEHTEIIVANFPGNGARYHAHMDESLQVLVLFL
jgi:hypothetical protein